MPKKKSTQDWRHLDPYFEREQRRYGNPIPSREFILQYLEHCGEPLSRTALCNAWQIDSDSAIEALGNRLQAMVRDGQLIQNRRGGYGIAAKMDLIKGRVIGHPEGYGFLKPEPGSGDDVYLSSREMRQLMHGDIAVVRIAGVDRRGRRQGALVEILERNTRRIVGRYFQEHDIGFVEPDDKRINQDILIPSELRGNAASGQIVIVEITEPPGKRNRPLGRIVEILGEHMAPGMEIEIAIVNHDIPIEWPDAVLEECKRFQREVPASAKRDRVDLRELPLVTIDGESARDFDDAVYCAKRGKNWRLLVAIADVSWYVRPVDALDREAQLRGNSVYFPDRVVPMLPEVLSNGLCSLNPKLDRLCLACDMTISPEGRILRSRFVEAVMRSHARLTYTAVASMVVDRDQRLRKDYTELVPHLDRLYELYQLLKTAREQRGGLDFDTQESVIEYSPDRKIERILPSSRNDAHRLIEECMIAANVAAARYLQRNKFPTLYRVHEGPTPERLENLRAFLAELGLGLGGGDEPGARDYALLLERVQQRPDCNLIQTVLLRSLQQAVYSPDNCGHFGLALDAYAHFTSPIRRYPDLLVHRAIRFLLHGGKARDFGYSHAMMEQLGEHCSMTERRADEATRDAVEWLKCEFMLDKLGDEYDGIVTAVTSFGLFVQLDEVFVEGLVHVTALRNDYYHFDPIGHRLRGERSGRVYRLGDAMRVKVVRVDLDERKIDFEPIETAPRTRRGPGKRQRRR